MAFVDGFDISFTIRHDLKMVFGHNVLLTMMTDSLSLFNILSEGSSTTEKWLMIDLQTVKDAYKEFEGVEIETIRPDHHLFGLFHKSEKKHCFTKSS